MRTRFSPSSVPWRIVIPIAIYILLTLLGINQSSVGVDSMREDPADPEGHMLGTAQVIRSDEWRTSSPLTIGATEAGSGADLNPLAGPDEFLTQRPAGPVSTVVVPESLWSDVEFIPDEMIFAARWWLPFLLLALGAPAFFRNLTGNRHIGWFAAALIAFSPASAWWSFTPLQIMATAIAGSAALQNASRRTAERRYVVAVAWSILSALILARTVMSYQPWALVLSVSVVLTASAGLVFDRTSWRSLVAVLGGTGTLCLAITGLLLLEYRESLEVLTDTIYPGSRTATGAPVPFQLLFGATSQLRLTSSLGLTATNQSEISSSFTILFVWILLLLTLRVRYHSTGHRAAVVAIAAFSAFWLSWSMVAWDALGVKVPLVNQVAPERAAQVVGYLAIVLLCLILPGLAERGSVKVGLLAAAACALVAASAGSLLAIVNTSGFSTRSIWIAAALLAAVVFTITVRPRRVFGYAAAGLLSLALVVTVNPLMFGLGDLRDSDAAQTLIEAGREARADGTSWASDNGDIDSLLMATGVPSISGRQMAGPDREAWEALAPGPANEQIWNRGGSYVFFQWNDSKQIQLALPSTDVIVVTGSPCEVAKRVPSLEHIIASQPLSQKCLTQVGTMTWIGQERWIYAVR